MILMHGEIIESNVESKFLAGLYDDCIKTLNQPNPITAEKVISACDKLYQKAMNGEYDDIALPLLKASDISYERFLQMAKLFSREELEYKCKIELGADLETLSLEQHCKERREATEESIC